MMHNNETERSDEQQITQLLENTLGDATPAEIESAMERQYRWAEAALSQQKNRGVDRPLRAAMAAMALLVLSAGAWITFDSLWQPKTTWAEVVDSFGGVTSLAVTLFKSDHANSPTMRSDCWIGPGGRVRYQNEHMVIFGAPGEAVTAFSVVTGERFNTDDMTPEELRDMDLSLALGLSRFLGENETAYLEMFLSQFGEDGVVPAPELNAVPSVSRDLLVFDAGEEHVENWMRVWALRESRLPVRVRTWDSGDGGSTETLFDYTSAQPEEAFDPDAYADALSKNNGTVNRRFALLRDPAGQSITPADVHAEVGYHLPEVVEAGRTAEGIVWVRSQNSTNQTPEGREAEGFGKLEDNHGQEYLHQYLGHRNREDMTLECFIPLNLGLDYQRPDSMILTAWSQPDHVLQPVYEFGSISLELPQEDRPIPDGIGSPPTAQDGLRKVITEWAWREHWDNFDRLLATIPGEPESDAMALFREAQRLDKLARMGQNDATFALSTRLARIVVDGSEGFPWDYANVIRNHVLQLVRRGKVRAATELLAPYRAVLRTEDKNTRPFFFVTGLVPVIERVQSTPDTARQIFGFDPRSIPAMVKQMKTMGGTFVPASEDPRFQPWRDYVATAARHYNSAPLPETYEVLSDTMSFPSDSPAYPIELPSTPGYTITRFGPSWYSVAQTLAYATEQEPGQIQVAPALRDSVVDLVVVRSDTLPTEEAVQLIAAREGVAVRETTVRKRVWVARYDGRPLPNWRWVRPPDLGEDLAFRGGGTSSTARTILKQFEPFLNAQADADKRMMVLDETGLPAEPGENQTWGTICLSNHYAFGPSPASVAKVKDWFRDNFGITFTEEERDVPMLEVVPLGAR
ncbi:MAG: hypothetical protein L3K26_01720 [Candidatus Hydrogenedentes bacterium]|nr:hypothetical protein [Candidatus Hydrogenedentota bacterium]